MDRHISDMTQRNVPKRHIYAGQRFTDQEVTDILSSHGAVVTVDDIRRESKYMKAQGISADDITSEIFGLFNVPYKKTGNCIVDWDFKDSGLRSPDWWDLIRLYETQKRDGETRIAFAIRRLKEKIHEISEIKNALDSEFKLDPSHPVVEVESVAEYLIDMYKFSLDVIETAEKKLKLQHAINLFKDIPHPQGGKMPWDEIFESMLPGSRYGNLLPANEKLNVR